MKAKIILFDEVLDSIKAKNIDDIFYVDMKEKEVFPLYEIMVNFLTYYSEEYGFFIIKILP